MADEAPPPTPPLPPPPPLQRANVYPPYQNANVSNLRRPSVTLPQLKENEKRFFELIHLGDVNAVRDFLSANAGFNINCVNFQGVSGLQIAVQNRSEPMIEFLLTQPNIDVGDCVLHAIRDNQLKIMEMLLNKQQQIAPVLEFAGVTNSSNFPVYMTPLILAAQCGHYEIIERLIKRGHTINKPHSPSCRCTQCLAQLESDDLLQAENLRINLYRAVSNPAYICHSTNDPILTSFELSQELRQCSRSVPEFRSAYLELADEVSNFAVNLISHCRNSNEIKVILSQKAGFESRATHMFPRLLLAIDMKQKLFVAHPHTQHIIETAWHGAWYDYNIKPTLAKVCYPIYRLATMPMVLIMCLFAPKHPLVEHWSLPVNRMFNHAATFLLFVILIFLESNIDKTNQKRFPPESGLEPIIMVYVIGNVWNIIRMCLIQGVKRYFRYLWNWHAIISNFFFILTFIFWLASYLDALNNDQIDLERKYWHHLDPILIAEGTFVVATIMTCFKLMFFCRLNYYLGPLQISLGKMCSDMVRYLTVFTIIILSFTIGLCRFYQPYDGMVQTDSNGIKTSQVSSFVDFSSTLKTFFWAILCMSPLESADVIIENLPGDNEQTTIINQHTFTAAVGYIAFAIFEVLIVVMLLNMLIATMSSTFQRVIDNIDVEWVFGKTDFYLEFMLQSTLPSPLNLIPTPLGITSFMELFQQPKYILLKEEESLYQYPALISQLVQRYFSEKDSNQSTENEVEALKQELTDLKNTVNEIVEQTTTK